MSLALRVQGLRRRYGRIVALDGLDLEVPRGSVCGLIGPNGAGKTTAFGIIAGLVRADEGHVDVLGLGPHDPQRHPGRVGLLPQDCALPPDLPVRVLLQGYAWLQGMSRAEAAKAADAALDEVALADRAEHRVGQLSHGMKRRVALAQALLGSPELILLDEPTNGLDPDLVVLVRRLLRARAPRATLLISSHVLHELEATCDHVIIMERGRCVASGSMEAFTGRGRRVRIQLDRPAAGLLDELAELGLELWAEEDWLCGQGPSEMDELRLHALLLQALLSRGVGVRELRAGQSLEASWMRARGGAQRPLA